MKKHLALILLLKKKKMKNHNFLNYVKYAILLLKMKMLKNIYNLNHINQQSNIMDYQLLKMIFYKLRDLQMKLHKIDFYLLEKDVKKLNKRFLKKVYN